MHINKSTAAILLLTLAMALLPSVAAAQATESAKKVYCWTEKGHQVCGDTVPPDAVDNARTEISAKSGNTMATVDRSLTSEERAAASAAAKLATADADAEAAEKRRDLAMVESYDTENDLRRAYGARITLVEESLKTSRLGMVNLRQSLLSLLRQAANLELQQQPVRKPLLTSIQQQHADLLRQQATLDQQVLDRASLGTDLEQALVRYRTLKNAAPAG